MFVFLEISQIWVKNLLCHSIEEIFYLPKLATDSCLIYFHCDSVIPTCWRLSRDSIPISNIFILAQGYGRKQQFLGECFWCYSHDASLILFLSRVCCTPDSLLLWVSVAWLLPACLTHCLLSQIMEPSKFPTSSWQVMSTETLQTQPELQPGLLWDTPKISHTSCLKYFLPGPWHLPQADADK